jgi:hypothetical protein
MWTTKKDLLIVFNISFQLIIYWANLEAANQDNQEAGLNLCYLSNRRSSQTFTVNEALLVDSVIGTLQVAIK